MAHGPCTFHPQGCGQSLDVIGVTGDHVALDGRLRGPEDMNVPSFKLHPLKGGLLGQWSVWVYGNWRVTFRFAGSDVELVDCQDYH